MEMTGGMLDRAATAYHGCALGSSVAYVLDYDGPAPPGFEASHD